MVSEEIKTLLSLNEELRNLVDTKLQLDISGGSNKTFFVAFVLGKAYKTHEVTVLLCKNGYGEDAFMLTRTLFELMVTTAYILQNKSEDRLMRYMNYDWVTRKKMYDYVKTKDALLASLNKAIESGSRENTIEEVEREYKTVMEKYNYRNGWSDRSIERMSESIGRLDMYSTVYRLQCMVSHTNARSMNEYITSTDQGIILNIGPNWNLVERSLVIAFDCFFHIAKEADRQFTWGVGSTLEEMATKYAEKIGQLKIHLENLCGV